MMPDDNIALRILAVAFLLLPGAALAGMTAMGVAGWFAALSGWTEFLFVFLPVAVLFEALIFWRFGDVFLLRDRAAGDMREGRGNAPRQLAMAVFPAAIFGCLAAMGAVIALPISEDQAIMIVGVPFFLLYALVFVLTTAVTPDGALRLRWRRER